MKIKDIHPGAFFHNGLHLYFMGSHYMGRKVAICIIPYWIKTDGLPMEEYSTCSWEEEFGSDCFHIVNPEDI